MSENKQVVLSVKDLKINFSTDHGYVQAVRGVSFDLYKGETLCIVGESGSGKSVTNKAIMGILSANGRIMGGSIMYEGEDLTKVSEDEFHRIRGHKIGMIFQDPLSSLNPIVRIGKQITEAMLINNSRLKKLFNDKVAYELVAYKNAETEYKSLLQARKEKIKFTKGEAKKEIAKIKYEPTMQKSGRIYTLKIEYNGRLTEVKEEYKAKLAENKEQAEALNAEKLEKINKVKAWYQGELAKIKEETVALKAEVPAKVNQVKEETRKTLEEINESNTESRSSLRAKFVPLIKERKSAYRKRAKEARKEVAEYKKELKQQYLYKVNHAKSYSTDKALIKEASKAAKREYISSIKITKGEAKARALEIMKEVGISNPEKRFKQYPFEFSGGMRQRIVIAIALTANPDILICDEPTTALDVTIQAQILELINKLKRERNISCIFITHDLGVVANMADRVAVMYAGKIVEYGTEDDIFYDPKHPYTWALLSSIPDIESKEKLEAIPGTPPNMIYPPKGDAFALRSKYAMAIDFKKEPPMFKVSDTHYAATWLLDPRAPKVEMPKIVKTRIENSLKAAKKGASK